MRERRAGRSASKQGIRQSRVNSVSQRWLAFLACVVSVCLTGFVGGWLIAFAALGAVFLIGTLVVLWNQTFGPPVVKDSWQRGSLGEQLTERVLSRLSSTSFVVIHDVALGSTRANVDHVVLGPTGLFVLDSKNWRGRASPDQHGVWKYGVPLAKTADSTLAERNSIVEFLEPEISAWNIPVYAAWVMTGTKQRFDAVGEVEVVALDHLVEFITKRPTQLSRRKVRRLAAKAKKLRPA